MFVRIFSGVAGIRKALLLRIINSAQKKIKKVVMSCLALFLLASLMWNTQYNFSKCGVILSGFSNCYATSSLKLNAKSVSQVTVLQNLNQKMMIQCIFTVTNVSCEIILASERCYLEINYQLFSLGLLLGLSVFQWHTYFSLYSAYIV